MIDLQPIKESLKDENGPLWIDLMLSARGTLHACVEEIERLRAEVAEYEKTVIALIQGDAMAKRQPPTTGKKMSYKIQTWKGRGSQPYRHVSAPRSRRQTEAIPDKRWPRK